jgi:hypothetical protein
MVAEQAVGMPGEKSELQWKKMQMAAAADIRC